MPAYTFSRSRLGNWELCPHLVVDLDTLELTSAFLETYSAQLPKSGQYYFLLQPAPAKEAAKQAHTLFQHSFFDKGIFRLRNTTLFQPLHLGFKCSSLPANMEWKHPCVLERHLTISPPSTLQHLEREQVPVCEGIIPRQAAGPGRQGAQGHHLPVSAHHLPGQDRRTMIQYNAAATEQRRQLRGLGVQHHHRARPQPQLQAGHQAPG